MHPELVQEVLEQTRLRVLRTNWSQSGFWQIPQPIVCPSQRIVGLKQNGAVLRHTFRLNCFYCTMLLDVPDTTVTHDYFCPQLAGSVLLRLRY